MRFTGLAMATAVAAACLGAGCSTDATSEQPNNGTPLFGSAGQATTTSSGAGGSAGTSGAPSAAAGVGGGGTSGGGGEINAAGAAALAGSGGAPGGASAGSGGGGGGPFVAARGSKSCDATALSLGEMRLLTNEWTDPLADTCVFLDTAGNFGWTWTRGATGTGANPNYPNYPELEFGINPWNEKGIDTSTTTLLPLQLKDVVSASMMVDVFTDVGAHNAGWNLAFELWLADTNPILGPAKPKGELMVFLSNAPDYYPAEPETSQTLNDGNHDYKLFVSSDDWGTWGYYRQYRQDTHDGKFNGKLDIGKFLQHCVQDEHWDPNLWLTRFELGNEVYQNSGGTTTIRSVAFEVNGQVRAAQTQ